MALIKEDFEKETLEAWRTYTAALEKSLEKLEKDIDEDGIGLILRSINKNKL